MGRISKNEPVICAQNPFIFRGMKQKWSLFILAVLFLSKVDAQVIFNKVDTTMKIGKAGYKVSCRNRSIKENQLQIRPIGFDADVKEMNFPIAGRLASTMVDDLNGDGWPDLMLFIYTDSSAQHGMAFALVSEGNKSVSPVRLGDAAMDGKINKGYKGGDEYSMMEGTLLLKFPIYKDGDAADKPTGGHRVVMYKLARSGEAGYKFDIIRTYETQ